MSTRVCSKDECGTILSSYNPGVLCSPHARSAWEPLIQRTMHADEWLTQALCRTYPAHQAEVRWFPESNREDDSSANKGLAVCFRCPVRRECLTWAVEHEETIGTWGGATATQRYDAQDGRPADEVIEALFASSERAAKRKGIIA